MVSTEREQIREQIRKLDPLDDVIGFQPMVLAQTTPCARCRTQLRRGDNGWLGLTVEPGRRVIVCSNCVPPADPGADETEEKE